jgi:excisionase family DNA binding protein
MEGARLWTLQETAETLRLSPHTIRSFVRQGKLRPVKICRRLLFRAIDVERLIEASCTTEQQ